MKQYKKHQVVMLPTDKESTIYFNNNDKLFQICNKPKISTQLKPNYHLYILSDEPIKELP